MTFSGCCYCCWGFFFVDEGMTRKRPDRFHLTYVAPFLFSTYFLNYLFLFFLASPFWTVIVAWCRFSRETLLLLRYNNQALHNTVYISIKRRKKESLYSRKRRISSVTSSAPPSWWRFVDCTVWFSRLAKGETTNITDEKTGPMRRMANCSVVLIFWDRSDSF